ncbi:hypothetical protein ABZ747_17855 [Kitasatospora cineracea]|uniref:hypothetical protein n=1 Tax=Kitasatospora cineracea TaxID=88074 RepID=UPI0033FB2D2C
MGLALDLVVTPDLSGHRWKDRAEYDRLRRLGVVDDFLARQVDAACGRVLTQPGYPGARPTTACGCFTGWASGTHRPRALVISQ